MLFFLVLMRMSGFIFLNPILGRRNIPATAKTGLSLGLAVIVFSMEQSQGITVEAEANSSLMFGILMVKELAIGYLLGFIMSLYTIVVKTAL